MNTNDELKNETVNGAKPVLCNVTLNFILSDCKERLEILDKRKQTSITLGRINEIQLIVCYLQQKILDNIA